MGGVRESQRGTEQQGGKGRKGQLAALLSFTSENVRKHNSAMVTAASRVQAYVRGKLSNCISHRVL